MTLRTVLALATLVGAGFSVAALSPSIDLSAAAQGASPPAQAATPRDPTCTTQYAAQADVSAGTLVTQNYQIKAAVPGGLWLQKEKDVFYCNSGIVADGDTMCWKLTGPVRGQACSDAAQKAASKPISN
ncbi:hypothetical protein [Reyranella sp.]|uniref:hypothetical protein n=1 Tax=Reyranella sp. TaxID=1929291 RepID=UPI003BAD7542